MADRELLDEKVIEQQGAWQRVRRWWRGVHPDKGVVTWGWTGWETVEERDRILPVVTIQVLEVAA
jgi:hypothetical protein